MVVFPAPTPVSTPVDAFIDATPGLLLLQDPPPWPLLVRVADNPTHTDAAPLIVPALANAFTVTSFVAVEVPHTLDTVYVIVVFPAVMPVTNPEFISIVAIPGALLVHVPPLFPPETKLMDDPIHTDEAPLIVPAFRTGFTVIGAEALAIPHAVIKV